MGWSVEDMGLPEEEEGVARAMVGFAEFKAFFGWMEKLLAGAESVEGVYELADVMGKVLIYAGESLRRGARDSRESGADGWDGSEPRPTR